MKTVISTIGRFHMFGLARELEKRNALTAIYTGFPWSAVARENVPRAKVKTFPVIRPVEFAYYRSPVHRFAPLVGQHMMQWSCLAQDLYVSKVLPECDVFVGHEATGLRTGAVAQRRGARYVCDRGCTHAQWRVDLLAEEYDRVGIVPTRSEPLTLDRELREYDLADRIVVPSTFAKNSFVDRGVPAEKVWVIPYGVDVSMFHQVGRPDPDAFRVLFVGGLSVRKGARDLFDAFDALDHPAKTLTIAGAVNPEIEAFVARRTRDDDRISFTGSVKAKNLAPLFSAHHVLVLPSVEDGFGMVMTEAMACGTPVIATVNTGAPDLYTDGVEGYIVPIRNPQVLAERLTRMARDPALRDAMSAASLRRIATFGGWQQYGDTVYDLYSTLVR